MTIYAFSSLDPNTCAITNKQVTCFLLFDLFIDENRKHLPPSLIKIMSNTSPSLITRETKTRANKFGRHLSDDGHVDDCDLWRLWLDDDYSLGNLPSPSLIQKEGSGQFLPPIDTRPLVCQNQFISQSWPDHFIGTTTQPPFSSFQGNRFCDASSIVEETVRDVPSAISNSRLDEILPSPASAEYTDSPEKRRPSYQSVLKSFILEGEKKPPSKEYSSSEFWRAFVGSRYYSMNVAFHRLQK